MSVDMINEILKLLPVGCGFRPTDEELVNHYLKLKTQGKDSEVQIIPVVDVCKSEPWELPDLSRIKTADPDWFFFSPVDLKYSNGSHVNRQTEAGYWKPTGQDREIKSGTNKIGTKKSLVFYKGRGRAALRTNWVIHQYRADIAGLPANRAYVLCHLMKKTDENTGPDEAVAGSGNGLANNMTLGAGLSHHASDIVSDIGNYQVEEMILDGDPELEGLLHEPTIHPLDYDLFHHTEQGLDLDLSSSSGYNNSCGSMQFQDEDDAEFVDGLFIDQDGYPYGGLSDERSSAVYGSIGRLSARPQSPLKGAYVKGSRSATYTEVLHVKPSLSQEASSRVVSSSKECMQSPMAQQQHSASGLFSINQQRLANSVAHGVAPKSVKLEGNDLNNEILLAKLAKLSGSMIKSEENSVSIKAKDRAEYGSATDLLQSKNPIRESKKDCEVPEKANPKLSSMTRLNEPVGSTQKGSFNSPETASASHEPSSSPAELVNFLTGIILFVILIVVMVLDFIAKV
ncbi:NAC domain-containing protein 62-like isoform X1 [Vitis riparia]|uniref:NAC domain-containing protein 62-like isoform X1 n=1 Tax=Vitis riparia TaxID=96939 RepID=UPI00155AEDA2|nr:NAC domain-containing protein 62-like isoform X1 [Vitis riparia]